MTEDPLSYERLVEDALRGVMRRALEIVAEQGLPGEHHFHITFRTDHPGVEMPEALRLQYPDEMTIVLQHMFWDLVVDDESFSVALSFNTIRQDLAVPFDAVTIFQDRSAAFALQFEGAEELAGEADSSEVGEAPERRRRREKKRTGTQDETPTDKESQVGGANIVPLDTFRKK